MYDLMSGGLAEKSFDHTQNDYIDLHGYFITYWNYGSGTSTLDRSDIGIYYHIFIVSFKNDSTEIPLAYKAEQFEVLDPCTDGNVELVDLVLTQASDQVISVDTFDDLAELNLFQTLTVKFTTVEYFNFYTGNSINLLDESNLICPFTVDATLTPNDAENSVDSNNGRINISQSWIPDSENGETDKELLIQFNLSITDITDIELENPYSVNLIVGNEIKWNTIPDDLID